MSDFQLTTPVVFLVFKRPDITEKVFAAIRQAKPPKLFVVADGPRLDRPDEVEKCAAVRAIIDRVDWDCDVLKNYSDTNLGCAKRVSSGLDWVFNNVEEAIILEDDCLPHPTFFRFCEELLKKYRYDSRIVAISGQNVQFKQRRTQYSYYFSRYNHCWGWATWKRAWQYFDFDMKLWPEIKSNNLLKYLLSDSQAIQDWSVTFQSTYDGKRDSWANRWTFACWIQSGLTILSDVNLISNLGFDDNFTNTWNKRSKYKEITTEPIKFPLKHPPFIIRNTEADNFTQKTLYNYRSLFNRIKNRIDKIFIYFLQMNKK